MNFSCTGEILLLFVNAFAVSIVGALAATSKRNVWWIVIVFVIALYATEATVVFGYPAPKMDKPLPPPVIDVGDVVEHIGTHDMLIVYKYVLPDKGGVFPSGYYWLKTHPGKGWLILERPEVIRFLYRPSTK